MSLHFPIFLLANGIRQVSLNSSELAPVLALHLVALSNELLNLLLKIVEPGTLRRWRGGGERDGVRITDGGGIEWARGGE